MAMPKTFLLAALASIAAASPLWDLPANITARAAGYSGASGLPVPSGSVPGPAPTSSGSPAPSGGPSSAGLGDTYNFYTGDGTTGQGWPDQDKWVDFDTMWNANSPVISTSCEGLAGQANPTDKEMGDLHDAILSVSDESSVDPRFILAIVMQESKGCVRVYTTSYDGSVQNPSLMQDHDGSGSCNTGTLSNPGNVLNPCPADQITQMIKDGTEGTAAGDGLVQCLSEAGTSDVSQYYNAARRYNSGSVDPSGNLEAGIATHCYSSDVANRLTGWVNAEHGCSLDG